LQDWTDALSKQNTKSNYAADLVKSMEPHISALSVEELNLMIPAIHRKTVSPKAKSAGSSNSSLRDLEEHSVASSCTSLRPVSVHPVLFPLSTEEKLQSSAVNKLGCPIPVIQTRAVSRAVELSDSSLTDAEQHSDMETATATCVSTLLSSSATLQPLMKSADEFSRTIPTVISQPRLKKASPLHTNKHQSLHENSYQMSCDPSVSLTSTRVVTPLSECSAFYAGSTKPAVCKSVSAVHLSLVSSVDREILSIRSPLLSSNVRATMATCRFTSAPRTFSANTGVSLFSGTAIPLTVVPVISVSGSHVSDSCTTAAIVQRPPVPLSTVSLCFTTEASRCDTMSVSDGPVAEFFSHASLSSSSDSVFSMTLSNTNTSTSVLLVASSRCSRVTTGPSATSEVAQVIVSSAVGTVSQITDAAGTATAESSSHSGSASGSVGSVSSAANVSVSLSLSKIPSGLFPVSPVVSSVTGVLTADRSATLVATSHPHNSQPCSPTLSESSVDIVHSSNVSSTKPDFLKASPSTASSQAMLSTDVRSLPLQHRSSFKGAVRSSSFVPRVLLFGPRSVQKHLATSEISGSVRTVQTTISLPLLSCKPLYDGIVSSTSIVSSTDVYSPPSGIVPVTESVVPKVSDTPSQGAVSLISESHYTSDVALLSPSSSLLAHQNIITTLSPSSVEQQSTSEGADSPSYTSVETTHSLVPVAITSSATGLSSLLDDCIRASPTVSPVTSNISVLSSASSVSFKSSLESVTCSAPMTAEPVTSSLIEKSQSGDTTAIQSSTFADTEPLSGASPLASSTPCTTVTVGSRIIEPDSNVTTVSSTAATALPATLSVAKLPSPCVAVSLVTVASSTGPSSRSLKTVATCSSPAVKRELSVPSAKMSVSGRAMSSACCRPSANSQSSVSTTVQSLMSVTAKTMPRAVTTLSLAQTSSHTLVASKRSLQKPPSTHAQQKTSAYSVRGNSCGMHTRNIRPMSLPFVTPSTRSIPLQLSFAGNSRAFSVSYVI